MWSKVDTAIDIAEFAFLDLSMVRKIVFHPRMPPDGAAPIADMFARRAMVADKICMFLEVIFRLLSVKWPLFSLTVSHSRLAKRGRYLG